MADSIVSFSANALSAMGRGASPRKETEADLWWRIVRHTRNPMAVEVSDEELLLLKVCQKRFTDADQSDRDRAQLFIDYHDGLRAARKEPTLPIVCQSPESTTIEWDATRYPVSPGWAEAFAAMIAAGGHPVGITRYVGKTVDAIAKLKRDAPALAALLDNRFGNKGYTLTLFSRRPNVGEISP